jgi:hypothetical protein
MVDAGASDAFWPQDYKWAFRTAQMLYDVSGYTDEAGSGNPDQLRCIAEIHGEEIRSEDSCSANRRSVRLRAHDSITDHRGRATTLA